MAKMSQEHRRWLRKTRQQRRKTGYLERYPVKSDDVPWKTAGGQRVARLFLDADELRTGSVDANRLDPSIPIFEVPPGVDPEEIDGEVILGPEWYADGISGFAPSKTLCPICHRGLKDGVCLEHGNVGEGPGYQWDERRKKWTKH